MSCLTNPSIIGKRMTFKNFLTLFFYRENVDYDIAVQLAEQNINNAYLRALYVQAYHETGGFTSPLYRNNYNMFGMKAPNSRHKYCDIKSGYAAYSSFVSGIQDRIGWDNQHNISAPINMSDIPYYYSSVVSKGYAEDVQYYNKLLHLYNVLEKTGYFDTNPEVDGLPNVDDIHNEVDEINDNDTSFLRYSKIIFLLPLIFLIYKRKWVVSKIKTIIR